MANASNNSTKDVVVHVPTFHTHVDKCLGYVPSLDVSYRFQGAEGGQDSMQPAQQQAECRHASRSGKSRDAW